MKKLLIGAAGLCWFVLVFACTFWMTFPSEQLGDRVRLLVFEGSNGEYDVQMDALRPWWFGASANNIRVSSIKPTRGGDPEVTPMLTLDGASVRVSPFGLKATPHVSGVLQIGDSEVQFDAQGALNKRGTGYQATSVTFDAAEFPVADLAALAGATIDATGAVDFSVDVASEDGMRSAEGEIQISASNILIASLDPAMTGGMDLGMEIPIEEVEIRIDIRDGKATIVKGQIFSDLATVFLEGDLTLRDDMTRSTINVQASIELGEKLALFKSFLKSAEWADGKFHYRCTGTVSRNHCREDRERNTASRSAMPSRAGSSDEDRERRKQDLKDRLRQNSERRAERSRERAETRDREELEDGGYIDEEDQPLDDEELDDEELEFDDEEPVDEVFED